MILYMMRGIPGSGKSTWAIKTVQENSRTRRVNRDELRQMINGGVYSKRNEENIVRVRDHLINEWLSDGYDVIVDDTNVTEYHRDYFKKIADKRGAGFKVVDIDTDIETCMLRDEKRDKPVGDAVIIDMKQKLVKTLKAERVKRG